MVFCGRVSAADSENDIKSGLQILINALRSTHNTACLRESKRIDVAFASNQAINLHLRNADLNVNEAEIIAKALHESSLYGDPGLNSFSMSYNPGLTDAGVAALAKALPRSLTEVGFAGCAIGDEGGAALVEFCRHAHGLRMICAESNRFSRKIKNRFALLSQERADLLVIV